MTNKNINRIGMTYARQSSNAPGASTLRTFIGKRTSIVVGLLLFPMAAFSHPFHLTWTDMNADEDGTVIYREMSGVFHEVGFVGPNVTSFTDDPPGAAGDTFCWTVRAFRQGDISGSSNETCASVPAPSNPGQRRGKGE